MRHPDEIFTALTKLKLWPFPGKIFLTVLPGIVSALWSQQQTIQQPPRADVMQSRQVIIHPRQELYTMGTFGRLHTLIVAAGMTMALAFSASSASALTLSRTVGQSGFAGFSGAPFPITGALPYDYTAQSYLSLTSLDSLSITLTMDDGDSALGDFDFNDLTLELDGINTGIKLNGFPDESLVTLTISGAPVNAAAILAALHADGKLAGTVRDSDPNDNEIIFPNESLTTLRLEGNSQPTPTPEPATWSLLGLGLAGLVVYRRRKK
jgi:PEP-CTERM motif